MKNLIFAFLTLITFEASSQIDLSCDASFVGVYSTIEVTYPIYDKIVVGGSYGYNITTNPYLTDRIGGVVGIKFDEWAQLELNLDFIGGFSYDDRTKSYYKDYMFGAAFGGKFHFCNNLFATVQVAWPGFMKVGFGVRLRPYKKLTVWDKQY